MASLFDLTRNISCSRNIDRAALYKKPAFILGRGYYAIFGV